MRLPITTIIGLSGALAEKNPLPIMDITRTSNRNQRATLTGAGF
jgi:hypothetical protein